MEQPKVGIRTKMQELPAAAASKIQGNLQLHSRGLFGYGRAISAPTYTYTPYLMDLTSAAASHEPFR